MPKKQTVDQQRRKSPKISITISDTHNDKLRKASEKTGKSISKIIDGILSSTPYWAE